MIHMTHKNKGIIFLMGSIFVVAIILTQYIEPKSALPNAPSFKIERSLIESGDLVFRRGRSLTSRVVLSADKRPYYSHVGIVYLTEKDTLVVHAVPGDQFNSSIPVKADPLRNFIDRQYAEAIAIRRLKNNRVANQVAKTAYNYVLDSVFFDSEFDIESPDRMYCTELVWRAYSELGIDLVGGVFDELVIPFGDGRYILPSSLLDSHYLIEVLTLPHHPGDHHD